MEALVDSLGWAERVVVAGEAILRRLAGHVGLASRLLNSCLPASVSSMPATTTARSPKKDNLEEEAGFNQVLKEVRQPPGMDDTGAGSEQVQTGISLDDWAERALLCNIMQRRRPSDAEKDLFGGGDGALASHGAAAIKRRSSADKFTAEDWGSPPLQKVRLLECECKRQGRQAGDPGAGLPQEAHSAGGGAGARLVHRLYARERPGELRLSTVVILEP
jgi:hypothetical protein